MRSTIQKLMWAAMIPALTGGVAQAQTYSNAVIALNPALAYWPLNETIFPPGAYIATNYGTLGAFGNAYYADFYPDDLGSPAASLHGTGWRRDERRRFGGFLSGHWLGGISGRLHGYSSCYPEREYPCPVYGGGSGWSLRVEI